jgi:hypothetical protein
MIAILFGLAIFLCGCSSTYLVSSTGKPNAEYSYQEMNEKLKEWDVKIKLKDGSDISAKDVKVSDDSVSWVNQETNAESKASILEINKIVINSSSIGALEGAGFGLVVGGGVGLIWGINQEDTGEIPMGVVGPIIGGGTGLIVGSITGAIIGHSYNYVFPTAEQSDSLRLGNERFKFLKRNLL